MNTKIALASFLTAGAVLALSGFAAAPPAKSAFSVKGMYVEGCSCSAPCPCEIVGVKMGCEGLNFFVINSGKFAGKDFSGAKVAVAMAPGNWIVLYVDAASKAKREAATAFFKTAFKDFGKIEAVKDAKVSISGKNGSYVAEIDGGKVAHLETKPVLGAKKKVVTISNVNDPINTTFMQGTTVKGSFKDGEHSFTLKGSNSYFNDRISSSGAL